jgi:hypothetical protein
MPSAAAACRSGRKCRRVANSGPGTNGTPLSRSAKCEAGTILSFNTTWWLPVPPEACRMPGVLDPPIARGKPHSLNSRLPGTGESTPFRRCGRCRPGQCDRAGGSRDEGRGRSRFAERIPVVDDHNAEPSDPVGVLAPADKWPASAHAPCALANLLGGSRRLSGTGKNHVGAPSINGVVDLLRQIGREQASVAARHGNPANRSVDLGKFHKELEAGGQVELQPP